MNIIIREFRSNLKSTLIWSICVFLFILMGITEYSGFAKMGSEAPDFINSLPAPMLKMIGMNVVNITEIAGYYTVFYVYFAIVIAAHSSMLGSSILLKEERDKTADFLYTKPLKRSTIITYKLIFAFLNVLFINLVVFFSSYFMVSIYNKGDSITSFLIKATLLLLLVQVIFMSLGLLISSLTKTLKVSTSITSGILIFTYIISLVIPLNDRLDFLKYISPFCYFDIKELLLNNSVDTLNFILSLIIILISLSCTYILYNRKDIRS